MKAVKTTTNADRVEMELKGGGGTEGRKGYVQERKNNRPVIGGYWGGGKHTIQKKAVLALR
jgi:hypothetical protein